MSANERVCCTVFGSFHKFKRDIDKAVICFQRIGVEVLAPEVGILYSSPSLRKRAESISSFLPLKSERSMSPKEVEDEFLSCIRRSDFVYLVNKGGYVGTSAAMELGFALALGKPVYSNEPIKKNLDSDRMWLDRSEIPIVLPGF